MRKNTLDDFLVRGDNSKVKVPMDSGAPCRFVMYPMQPEVREYQVQMVATCVCYNTLVCLPTGLGKTLVASILLSNFANWFPQAKCLFLAPTRPLVRQQRLAFTSLHSPSHHTPSNTSSFSHPPSDLESHNHNADSLNPLILSYVTEVSGEFLPSKRMQLYAENRIIFATPQTIDNDLRQNKMAAEEIIKKDIDECHRATGNYAYANIASVLEKECCRMVGLSATPGNTVEKIQEVIDNLRVAKILYKDETSAEVKKHTHIRQVVEIVVSPTSLMLEAMHLLRELMVAPLHHLIRLELLEPWILKHTLTAFTITRQFKAKIDLLPHLNQSFAYQSLQLILFIYRCQQTLLTNGYASFKHSFFGTNPSLHLSHSKEEVLEDDRFSLESFIEESESDEEEISNRIKYYAKSLPSSTKINLEDDSNTLINSNKEESNILESRESNESVYKEGLKNEKESKSNNKRESIRKSEQYKRLEELFSGETEVHPKIKKMKELMKKVMKENGDKRVIIFTEYRNTAREIKEELEGEVRCELFHGQAKSADGAQLSRKEQIALLERFKGGEIEALISTCIGEEGLDIGEVDCIICYDGGLSPIRIVQRSGRTGRKRDGIVYVLLTEGKEKQHYAKNKLKTAQLRKTLTNNAHLFKMYGYNPSIFPPLSFIPITFYNNHFDSLPMSLLEPSLLPSTKKHLLPIETSSDEISLFTENEKNNILETKTKIYSKKSIIYEKQEIKEKNIKETKNKRIKNSYKAKKYMSERINFLIENKEEDQCISDILTSNKANLEIKNKGLEEIYEEKSLQLVDYLSLKRSLHQQFNSKEENKVCEEEEKEYKKESEYAWFLEEDETIETSIDEVLEQYLKNKKTKEENEIIIKYE